MKKPVKKVAPAPSKVRSYDVSADAPLKPLKPKRPGVPASLRRDQPKVSAEKAAWSRAAKAEVRAREKSGEAAGDYGRLFDTLTKGTPRRDMDEAERLEKVTDLTLSLEATISKKDDVDLVEGLVAATTCYNRGVGAFLPLFERQKNAYKNELLWRLKVRREAALGNPAPVRITKERPVYGKDVDARPFKTMPNKSRPPKQTPAERDADKRAMGWVPGQKPAELGPISRAIRQAGEEMRGTVKKVAVPVKPSKPMPHKALPPVKPVKPKS